MSKKMITKYVDQKNKKIIKNQKIFPKIKKKYCNKCGSTIYLAE